MAGKNVLEFNEQNFESEVLRSTQPVLVDFTATWCGPCRVLAPIVEKVADEFAGKIKVGKLDIDESPAIAAKYGRDPARRRRGRHPARCPSTILRSAVPDT